MCDGKRLGKVCDVVFTFSEGRVKGIVVPGCKGFRFGRADVFIDLKNVSKIGVDVVLVDIREPIERDKKRDKCDEGRCPPEPPPRPHPRPDRRDYGEYE